MRGIVLIGVILGLIYWAASTIDLPQRSAAGAIAEQQVTPWRHTSAGWLPLDAWMKQPHHRGWAVDPVTLASFEALFAVFVMVALSRKPEVSGEPNG